MSRPAMHIGAGPGVGCRAPRVDLAVGKGGAGAGLLRLGLAAALLLAPWAGTEWRGAVAAQASEQLEVATAPGAVLRGLDKAAGAAHDITVSVGGSATFGRLVVTLTDCRYPLGNPAADGYAHLVIHDTRTPDTAVFRGWMVASSPALNALDHPRYDIWLIRCTSD